MCQQCCSIRHIRDGIFVNDKIESVKLLQHSSLINQVHAEIFIYKLYCIRSAKVMDFISKHDTDALDKS